MMPIGLSMMILGFFQISHGKHYKRIGKRIDDIQRKVDELKDGD